MVITINIVVTIRSQATIRRCTSALSIGDGDVAAEGGGAGKACRNTHYIYIYIYTHTYINKYIYIYIHMYIVCLGQPRRRPLRARGERRLELGVVGRQGLLLLK